MGWLEMELWGRQPQRSPKGPSHVLSLRPSSGQLPVRLFLEETVPIHAFLAQAAERGLGNFGELCWGPAKAGEVERFLALLSAGWGLLWSPSCSLSSLCFCSGTEAHSVLL